MPFLLSWILVLTLAVVVVTAALAVLATIIVATTQRNRSGSHQATYFWDEADVDRSADDSFGGDTDHDSF